MVLIFLSTGSHSPTKAPWTQTIPNTISFVLSLPEAPTSFVGLGNHSIAVFIFQVYIFCPLQGVSSNSFNNLLCLIFLAWCLWMLHPQGKVGVGVRGVTWNQRRGFGNTKINLGILNSTSMKSISFYFWGKNDVLDLKVKVWSARDWMLAS